MSLISMDKQYKTRDGREVRIYAVDGGGNLPVHGAVLGEYSGEFILMSWRGDGRRFGSNDACTDLVEVTQEHKRWYVVSPTCGFLTQEAAQEYAKRWSYGKPIAVVPITFCEGDGL